MLFKGSDIETLGPENALDTEAEVAESGATLETELLDQSASATGMLLCSDLSFWKFWIIKLS